MKGHLPNYVKLNYKRTDRHVYSKFTLETCVPQVCYKILQMCSLFMFSSLDHAARAVVACKRFYYTQWPYKNHREESLPHLDMQKQVQYKCCLLACYHPGVSRLISKLAVSEQAETPRILLRLRLFWRLTVCWLISFATSVVICIL